MHLVLAVCLGLALCGPARFGAAAVRIAEGEVLRGSFVQERHLRGFAAPLRSEGQFVLAPGRGLIWKTEKPFAVTTVITESGLMQEVNSSQTLHMPAAKLPFLARLYHMMGGALAGDWRGLEDDFTLLREGGDDNWQLRLTPKKPDQTAMPFRAIALHGARFVDHVTLIKPDGDFDQLRFHDQVLSVAPLAVDETRILDLVGR